MVRCYSCKSTDVKKVSAIISQGSKSINLGHGVVGGSKGGGLGGALGKTGGSIKSDLVKKLERRKPGTSLAYGFILIFVGFLIFFYNDVGIASTKFVVTLILTIITIFWIKSASKRESLALNKFKNEWYCFKCGEISLTPGFNKKRENSKKTKK